MSTFLDRWVMVLAGLAPRRVTHYCIRNKDPKTKLKGRRKLFISHTFGLRITRSLSPLFVQFG